MAGGGPSSSAQDSSRARPDLIGLLTMIEEDFDGRCRSSLVRRATWAGLLSNACIALGNGAAAGAALQGSLQTEREAAVLEEVRMAWMGMPCG